MSNSEFFIRKIVAAGFLMLLFLGAFSQVIVAAEMGPNDLIDFSTFLGGTDDDRIESTSYGFGSTTVDSKGNIIVVGQTKSTDFPLKDAFQDHLNGLSDGIISKFDSSGSLIFSTYFGGAAQEVITDVAVDSEDNIIIAGITGSLDLPLVDPFQANSSGGSEGNADCFIAKFSEDGQNLLFSTYFGGTGSDWCYTMNVDSNDRIAISGTTESNDFPLMNAHQSTNAGALDVFISFLEADGQSLLFSTYLGTSGIDHGRRIDFDSQGDVLLTGMTADGDLATAGAYQEEHAGSTDAFLAKFNTNGTLKYLTFLGGSLQEWANDLAVDSEDNAIITGFTTSDDYPTLNAYQSERNGAFESFITKLTPDGKNIVFSTYMGGVASDYSNALTVDQQDRIIVTGQTNSADFPTTLSISTSESMYDNVSLAVLNHDGSLLFSMVFGGVQNDIGIGVAQHSGDSFVVAGYTASADFPTYDAYQDAHGGDYDMFVMKIDLQGLIDAPQAGFPSGLMEIGVAVGIIAVVALVFIIRKRAS